MRWMAVIPITDFPILRRSCFRCRQRGKGPEAPPQRHPGPRRESSMTSVRTVLVVGGGTAGATLAALLGRAGVAVEIVERKPGLHRSRVRHHPARSGAARARAGRRAGRAARGWRPVRRGRPAFRGWTHPGREPDTAHHGRLPPEAGGTAGRGRGRRRYQGPARCHGGVLHPGRRRGRRGVQRRRHRPVRPAGRRRRGSLRHAFSARDRGRRQAGRHGHLAGARPPSRRGRPLRALLRRALLHRGVHPHRPGHALRLSRRACAEPFLRHARAENRGNA